MAKSQYAGKVRINLHIYDRQNRFTVLHIGFFPKSAVKSIIQHMDARGIAYHHDTPDPRGMVDIVTYLMDGPSPAENYVSRQTYCPKDQSVPRVQKTFAA